MTGDEKSPRTIIAQTRFLVVDTDPRVGEGLRRFLTAENAPKVYLAQTPILALRIIQDRRTPVDCVICAHRSEINGLEFLYNLRSGRYGGLAVQNVKFVMLLPEKNEQVMAGATQGKVSGFLVGSLDKESVRKAIVKAIDPQGTARSQANFKVAQMRASEADLVLALFPPSFGRWPADRQQRAMHAVSVGAQKEKIGGGIAAIFRTDEGTAFLAAPAFHRFLSKLTVDGVELMMDRPIYVDWPDGPPPLEPKLEEIAAAALVDDPMAPLPLFEEEATDRRRLVARAERNFARGLGEDDIRAVAMAFKEMGPEEFIRRYVRHQAISLQDMSQPLTPMMREFYVSIELLRKSFFPGVEMRGSKRSFQSLTHLLDQLMLRSLPHLPLNGLPASLNLNVHSILGKTFETALQSTRADLLTFEIPQPMIGSYFNEFTRARDLITSHGAKVAVDQIFPDTIGELNLDQVAPNIAKLHWKGDLKNFSQTHRDFVKRTMDRGITMVMSRVDDPAAFEIAQEFGITNFQGFLIDQMSEEAK